jgi:hypothetical protein
MVRIWVGIHAILNEGPRDFPQTILSVLDQHCSVPDNPTLVSYMLHLLETSQETNRKTDIGMINHEGNVRFQVFAVPAMYRRERSASGIDNHIPAFAVRIMCWVPKAVSIEVDGIPVGEQSRPLMSCLLICRSFNITVNTIRDTMPKSGRLTK